ncbi:TonB-dependent receptor [Novosphingobium piscinae]|uniref:TonB-dependent receptor n=1 Tax=Novosphingobium piscinae TaxID=1507448 RepID=A0A7X1KNF9_9SPHN|nr:TonB-dependent receptor [Novosphingobium piscinae]MBC2667649.1 TonB-dependent receptor [Novosphingobium piscinae]
MKRIALTLFASASALAVAPAIAQAQSAAAPAAAAEEDAAPPTEEIIVTGTSRSRVALDTPLAVSQLNTQALTRAGVSSQADILNTIPTIKADGGGGEVAANIFVKGLPSGGQYQFTPLMYDGIAVLSSFGLNSSAYDVYARNDLGIARLEFVRGGVSNLFGPGSVAGLINYISKTGSDRLEGTVQLEVAQRDRYRGDVALSGPLGNNLYFAVSGFYRTDKGPVRTNLDTKGGQIRGNLEYRFSDGSGSVRVLGQYIDDQVQFYLPIPLQGSTRERLAGNDGQIVNSVQNAFNPAGLGFRTPTGSFTSEINEGVATKGGMVGLIFDKEFGDSGWALNGRFKVSDYKHKFGLWSDGDGVINVPETLQSFLTNRGLGSTANAQFSFVGGGAVPGNFLVFANRFTDRVRPARDATAELNLTKTLQTGGIDHALTFGGFYGRASAGDYNVTTTFLAEFNNRPRLINLTVTNPTTSAQTVVSNNGLLNAGAGYVNNWHKAERYAGYFADQMKIGERFNLDIGGRIETIKGDISRERTSTTVTDSTTPNLSAALRDVIWGNGGVLTGKVSTTEWALAVGALYKLTDRVSLYANGSRGFFFPELRSAAFKPLPTGTAANASLAPGMQSYTAEIIKQAEAGIKISQPQFSMTVAGIYTKLDNRRQVLFVNDGAGGFIERVNLVGTESYGVEATLDLRLLKNLRFNGNLTIQGAKYTAFDTTPAFIGNNVERQPEVLYNAGLYYDDGALDAAVFTNYTGDNFTASNNTIRLRGWHVVNLDAGYRIPLGASSVRVSANVFNLLNSAAVTEGSPRQDNNQTSNGAFFVGRPVLPRRIMGRIAYSF